MEIEGSIKEVGSWKTEAGSFWYFRKNFSLI
jgi:hypothetical protein